MKLAVCVIAPVGILNRFAVGRPFHLALAHQILTDQDYSNFYREESKRGSYVIVDNSLFENGHVSLTLSEVMGAAIRVQAQEVVLPDVFKDGPATYESTKKSLQAARNLYHGQFRYAAVAQGSTPIEFLECFTRLLSMDHIYCVQVPKVMDTIWPGGRAALMHYLNHYYPMTSVGKPVHLLGIWTDPIELVVCHNIPWIRSVDTALPVQAAMQNVQISPTVGLLNYESKPKRPKGFFHQTEFSDEVLKLCSLNIMALDSMCM